MVFVGRQYSVLLVDDDALVLTAHRRGLLHGGFLVQVAEDGAEALELLQGATFDAIVTDLDMPRVSGLELLRQLRADGCRLPIIVVTSCVAPAELDTAVRLGAARVFTKPIDLGLLVDASASACRASH